VNAHDRQKGAAVLGDKNVARHILERPEPQQQLHDDQLINRHY
jgi:hypothetical protein